MCISFNNTQSEKASTPILLTLFGIIIDVIFFFIRFGIVLRLILSTLDKISLTSLLYFLCIMSNILLFIFLTSFPFS